MLGFEVTRTYLIFLALFHFLIYILMSFPKSLLSISLKVIMFLNSFFKFHVVNISTLHVLIFQLRGCRSLEISQEACTIRILGSVLNSLRRRTPSGPDTRLGGRASVLSFIRVRFSLATILDQIRLSITVSCIHHNRIYLCWRNCQNVRGK